MDITINPKQLRGSLDAIASKSVAHRLMICAALADSPTKLICTSHSVDIEATRACLQSLGATITQERDLYTIVPIDRNLATSQSTLLNAHESGSTFRFILPVAAALNGEYHIVGEGRLADRPMSPLYEELVAHGVTLSEKQVLPLSVKGPMTSGLFKLPGNVSSQFVSGLLLAAPLLDGSCEIVVTKPVESLPYITLTLQALKRFGVSVNVIELPQALRFYVPAAAHYTSPRELSVEGDWSNAAFWLVASAISSEIVEVKNLDMNTSQGDAQILEFLKAFGADVLINSKKEGCVISAPHLSAPLTPLDVRACPDLVPPLAVLAAYAQGTTHISGAHRLRIKESDRLLSVSSAIKALGGSVEIDDDNLYIHGTGRLQGGVVDAQNDHRIAMMAAIAASAAHSPSTIIGAECVNKSYPQFFEDFAALGGLVSKGA